MIVQILGANGAGKSTIVRRILDGWTAPLACYATGRKKPLYYICARGSINVPPLVVIGHYEIANGGCDTIGSVREIKRLMHTVIEKVNGDMLLEGKTGREPSLVEFKEHDVRPVLIDIPLEECVASVRARGHSVARHVVARAHAHARRMCDTYEAAGIKVFRAPDRDIAREYVERLVDCQ